MDLSKYQELTGITIPSSKTVLYTANINRCLSMMETMLGFTLDSNNDSNFYNEEGKSRNECACPNVETENLQDPDEVEYAYRLYEYNDLDRFLFIDPFETIYKVKLVHIKQGAGNNGVTLKTFDDNQIRVDVGREGFSKYLELCKDCFCDCECTNCIQLAVDAKWLWYNSDNIPVELLYVLCEMVTYYADSKKDIKSESITTHSYTKFDRILPEIEPHNLTVIKKYAGPNGSVVMMPTTGAQGRRI